ncbi:anhydro-N-acetylmuramic acid kinase [Vibrio caribbeanicus]
MYVGVMSGTSMDGVDTALVQISDDQVKLIAYGDYPMPDSIKNSLLSVCNNQTTNIQTIGELDHKLGHLFADAVLDLLEQSEYSASQIKAIGCHGQTVFHQPDHAQAFSLQLGDANIIAAKTGIDTVADFRRKDIALGGQGAPLVPAFHQQLFAIQQSTTVVLNIGGIANISVLHPHKPVIGYDTGPGNVLMDAWCHLNRQEPYDRDGRFAQQGEISHELLNQLLENNYFAMPPPKSTGRERFNLDWLQKILINHSLSTEDIQRTLCQYSATSIANEVGQYSFGDTPQLLVCGGGARNPLLMRDIKSLLPNWQVSTTEAKGINGDYMEAMAFAWLAHRNIHKLPSSLPEVTGASRPASLGVYYPKD